MNIQKELTFTEELNQIREDMASEDNQSLACDDALYEVLFGAFTATYYDDPITETELDIPSFRYGLVRAWYRIMTVTP